MFLSDILIPNQRLSVVKTIGFAGDLSTYRSNLTLYLLMRDATFAQISIDVGVCISVALHSGELQ